MTQRLILKNLPFTVDERELAALLRPFGDLRYFRIARDRHTSRHLGSAFIEFATPEENEAAMAGLDGTQLAGRRIGCERVDNRRQRL